MEDKLSFDFPRTLRRVIQEVSRANDLQSSLDTIVDQVKSAMNTEVCSVYLVDEDRKKYVFMATRGLNQESVGLVTLEMDEGLVGLVGERAEPVNLDDAQSHPRNRYIEEIGEEPFHSFLGVPIIHHRKVLGVLVVQQGEARRFDESEEAFMITLSAHLAGVIAHARATGSLMLGEGADDIPTTEFRGRSGAPGVGIGTAVVVYPDADLSSIPERLSEDSYAEVQIFKDAVEETRDEIRALSKHLGTRLRPGELGLFDAYLQMLDDTEITGEVIFLIRQGEWSQGALRKVIENHVANFQAMDDEILRERGADIRDLGIRVLAKLQKTGARRQEYPQDTILIGEEVSATELMSVPRECLRGFVSVRGSANSHVAILAEAMGIPAVMGIEDFPTRLVEGKRIIVDGFGGSLIAYPNREQIAYYERVIKEEAELVDGLGDLADRPCTTKDGHRILLWVNTGLMTDVARSLERGAEGVGLYRTEVYFMTNDRFPTEEEQRKIYREHLMSFHPRPVTMRTLDIGGDKSLSYFPIKEENPFLGWRGIRVTLDHREIFLAQIRAMIKANEGIDNELRIMLPMVSSVAEVDEAQHLISQCYRELVEEGIEVEMPDVGVMIEVPAAVFQARDIIRRVDFLSVGSNDLIQYMLAVDRNNAQVADLYQEFHPAVLHALQHVVSAAHGEGKQVSICGEMAGNPSAALLLMAMGFDILSMNATNLLMVKWALTSFAMAKGKRILNKVLKMDNAYLIRSYVDEQLRSAGLGAIIRGGQGSHSEQP
ncbi:MAG: phosphoenolpyruvate--protein phosphotransferase [Proteobacteria bacterium]|nr:phosphoenolpyruvate--protein phosphotransferase [Pseudomonadota bacterium]